jgi:hypothetical protein
VRWPVDLPLLAEALRRGPYLSADSAWAPFCWPEDESRPIKGQIQEEIFTQEKTQALKEESGMMLTLTRAKSQIAAKAMLLSSLTMALVVSAMALPHSLGFLVSQFGISWQDALSIISAFVTFGSNALVVLAPWLVPLLGTLDWLIFFVGVSAAAGW